MGKKRNYKVTYEVEVRNNLEKENQIFLVAPLPRETEQQKLKSEIIFEPADCQVKTDRVFGNQYAIWRLNLKPKEMTVCRFSFRAEILLFKTVLPKNFQLSDYGQQKEDNRTLFVPNRFLQFDKNEIRTLAWQTIGQEKNVGTILKTLNNFVMSQLNYGRPIDGLYSAQETWENKIADCGGFSALLIALCLTVGIPARLVVGFWAGPPSSRFAGLWRASPPTSLSAPLMRPGYEKNEMHAWLEIMLPDGRWLPADPAVENLRQQGRTKRKGRLGFIGNDRIIFSYGCDIPLEIGGQERRVDILQNPMVFSENDLMSCSAKVEFKTFMVCARHSEPEAKNPRTP